MTDWETFVRHRKNELHPYVFNPNFISLHDPSTTATNQLAYKFYSRELYRMGYGTDYEQLPQLTLPILPSERIDV